MEMRVQDYHGRLARRVPVLVWMFAGAMTLVSAGYAWIQIRQGEHFRELSENNRLRREPIHAPRGVITSRGDQLLAENIPSYNLLLRSEQADDVAASLRFASGILDRPVAELRTALERTPAAAYRPALIAEELTLQQVARLSAIALERPEFEVVAEAQRLYRYGPLTAHALGWLGEVSESELAAPESSYRAGDLVGRRGVERVYDDWLRGTDGEREVVVDSYGRRRQVYERVSAEPGQPLRLAIDLELQQEAQRLLEGQAGAVVALDPRDGAVRALASAPSYDPNLFSRRLNLRQWEELRSAPRDPLNNRAVQSAQPPGSVFKIVMAAAGLAEQVVTPRDRVHCSGSATYYGARRRCWKVGGHGWVDLRSALVNSCDIYFYELGQKLGIDRIAYWARHFGFGEKTGIDIDGEVDGNVPDTEWARRERGAPWYPGETISVAIGQGPILTTPVQIAVMLSSVATGGRRPVPRLAARRDPASRPTSIPSPILDRVREALWAVVNERGTGASARVPGLDVAGKTGTVQVIAQATRVDSADLPYQHRDHAWFASFAPAADPELVIVVYVEHGGRGSQAAAPIARRLYEVHFRQRLQDRG